MRRRGKGKNPKRCRHGIAPIRACDVCRKEQLRAYRARNREKLRVYNTPFVRRYRYGLDQAAYKHLVETHGGKCGICHTEAKLNIDHDHVTGSVRGLLCTKCNQGLGYYERCGWQQYQDYLDKYAGR